MNPDILTDKIRSGQDFKTFLIEKNYYYADYDAQYTAYFLDWFKKGEKKLFKCTEVTPFYCPISMYVLDSQVKYLKTLVIKFPEIKKYFNDKALDKCPREYYLAIFAKLHRTYMLDVRRRVLHYNNKPAVTDKKTEDPVTEQFAQELNNSCVRPKKQSNRMSFKTTNINGVKIFTRQTYWKTKAHEVWKDYEQENNQDGNI
eukprot:Mrub_10633.p2 GENE.Mrub_10633~~Mrub_10633.p2  ORF type:complete len:214 (+),score=16.57 Mrub_10633:40-642(+)